MTAVALQQCQALLGFTRSQLIPNISCVSRDEKGNRHVLKAFSGQMANSWHVPGWVGPIASVTHESPEYVRYRTAIERLSRRIARTSPAQEPSSRATDALSGLKASRRALSHELAILVQQSYVTRSVGGAPLRLLDVFLTHCTATGTQPPTLGGSGKRVGAFPAGLGDCCAPKLLHAAAAMGLRPSGLAEFWYGAAPRENTPARASRVSTSERVVGGKEGGAGRRKGRRGRRPESPWVDEEEMREHGRAYGPCGKCKIILGTMLHGTDEGGCECQPLSW